MRARNLRWLSTAVILALVASASSSGCARTMHRRAGFGIANHTFRDRQAAAVGRGPTQGLDSEEAAIIHERYRAHLAGRSAVAQDAPRSPVLVLQEQGNAGARGR